ncbi:acyl-CoA dehydrogenase family protein [Klebsiella quasipneumoniae]
MAEQAASLDASGDFPWRNIDPLRARGWLSLAVPRAYGGAGASLAQLQQAIAAIAWGEPATADFYLANGLIRTRLDVKPTFDPSFSVPAGPAHAEVTP